MQRLQRNSALREKLNSNPQWQPPCGKCYASEGEEFGAMRLSDAFSGIENVCYCLREELAGSDRKIACPRYSLGCWAGKELAKKNADGKARRIKPGLEPLVDGLPGRVGLLRGYGNAIVPQLAAEFIKASGEAIGDISMT